MDTTAWERREERNKNILKHAEQLQNKLNTQVSEHSTVPLKIKTSVTGQDVFGSNDELTVLFINSSTLYVRASSSRHNEGDVVAILLGDLGPIQFINPRLQKMMVESFADLKSDSVAK